MTEAECVGVFCAEYPEKAQDGAYREIRRVLRSGGRTAVAKHLIRLSDRRLNRKYYKGRAVCDSFEEIRAEQKAARELEREEREKLIAEATARAERKSRAAMRRKSRVVRRTYADEVKRLHRVMSW